MKFSKEALIQKIDSILETDSEARARWEAEQKRKAEQDRKEWLATKLPHWKEFAEEILDKVALKELITVDDVPEGLKDRYAVLRWYYPEDAGRWRGVNRDGLVNLKAIIEASVDETISTTSLREMGFRDLGKLLGGS